mmetsp:Transcript_2703/g.6468  ORF Transcript_2703/g.6468 Transcript_2703/m.6468 type:complete len:215 (+) Transcript_2703:1624-2268(+)
MATLAISSSLVMLPSKSAPHTPRLARCGAEGAFQAAAAARAVWERSRSLLKLTTRRDGSECVSSLGQLAIVVSMRSSWRGGRIETSSRSRSVSEPASDRWVDIMVDIGVSVSRSGSCSGEAPRPRGECLVPSPPAGGSGRTATGFWRGQWDMAREGGEGGPSCTLRGRGCSVRRCGRGSEGLSEGEMERSAVRRGVTEGGGLPLCFGNGSGCDS